MDKWILLSVASLVGISIFSLYVADHLAKGIICSYVFLTPYALPLVYGLGFLFGYSLPQLRQKDVRKNVLGLFTGDERIVIEATMFGKNQAELAVKIGKVRAHRTIKSLELRGLVERTKTGNTYRLKPGKNLEKML